MPEIKENEDEIYQSSRIVTEVPKVSVISKKEYM